MNEPALKFAGNDRKWGAVLVALAFAVTGFAVTSPLPMPTRPVSFPLSAPVDQGMDVLGWG